MRGSRRVALTALNVAALGILASSVACPGTHECDQGESRCASPTEVEMCMSFWPDLASSPNFEWRPAGGCAQGTACVEVQGVGARCVTGGDKDPSCDQALAYCRGDELVECTQGYGVQQTSCGDPDHLDRISGGSTSTKCIPTAAGGATCIPSAATLDPICGGGSTPHCDGSTLVDCVEGFAAFRARCRTCEVVVSPADACSDCSISRGVCKGYLGDTCSGDVDCADALSCQAGVDGFRRCTSSCAVGADADGGTDCARSLGAGALPLSSYAEIEPAGVSLAVRGFVRYPQLACIAGFCTWIPDGR